MKISDLKYVQIETDANERNKSKSCYQDTINKILFVELQKDLNNINLIFN